MSRFSHVMRRRIFALAAGLVFSTGISALSAAPPEVLKEVPSDAYAVIAINNTRLLANKISNAATRLNIPGIPPDLIGAATRAIGIKEGFDPNSSVAAVMLKPSDEQLQAGIFSSQPPIVLIVPTTDAKAMLDPFKPGEADKDGIMEVSLPSDPDTKGYAAIVDTKWVAVAQKKEEMAAYIGRKSSFAQTASPETLKVFEANDLVSWYNVEKLAAGADKSIDDALTMVTGRMDLESATTKVDALQSALQKQMVVSAFSFAKEYVTDATDAMLAWRLSDSGATMSIIGNFKKDSPLAKFVGSQAQVASSGLAASLKGLPGGNFIFAGGAALNPDPLVKQMGDFEDKLLADPGVAKDPRVDQLRQTLDGIKQEMALVQGGHMVLLDPSAGGQNGMLNGAVLIDASDAQKLMTMQTQLTKNSVFLQDASPYITQKVTTSPNAVTIKGVHLDRLNLTMALKPDSPDNPVPEAIKAEMPIIQKMYGPDGLTVYTGVVGKRVLWIYGSDNVTLESAVSAAQANSDELSPGPMIAATKEQIVANPLMVTYLPVARWITLAQSMLAPPPAAGSPGPGPNITNAPPVLASAGVTGTTLTLELHVPIATITGIREASERMERAMMPAGGAPGPDMQP